MEQVNNNDLQLLNDFIEQRRALIMQLQISKGLKASGLSAQLLRTELQPGTLRNVAQLVDAAGYFEFQEFGRAAGKMPPFKAIYDWLEFKKYGLNYANDKERRSLAWALMIKIRKLGTHTYIKGTPSGVLSESLNNQLLDEFISKIIAFKTSEIATDITRLNL